MLAKFIAGAGCPTLKAVATMLEVESASRRRTIHRIEVAIGGPVLTDYRASAPLCLTPLGRRLVRRSVRAQPSVLSQRFGRRGNSAIQGTPSNDPSCQMQVSVWVGVL